MNHADVPRPLPAPPRRATPLPRFARAGHRLHPSLFPALLAAVTLSLAAAAASAAPPSLLLWTFDPDAPPGPRSPALERPAGGQPEYSDDVAGAFLYDPLSGRSIVNRASLRFHGDPSEVLTADWPFPPDHEFARGLTIECYFKPEGAFEAPLVMKSRDQRDAPELGLTTIHLRNHNQHWFGALAAAPGDDRRIWNVGHYSSSTRLLGDTTFWRHLALVFDPASRTLTCYLDHHLVSRRELDDWQPPDRAPLWFGGDPGGTAATGWLDAVRVTAAALGPEHFLRAREDSISGVSFVTPEPLLPEDSGALDIRRHFGAAGDGVTDDTAAFNAAFAHLTSKVPLAYHTLVIPEGTYLVSDMILGGRFIDIVCAGPDKTIIRLRDGSFTDPEQPRPVLRLSSTSGDPGSNQSVNGSSISIYLSGLTVDTGRDNPGAKGIEYHSNNLGRLENVVIRSGDGSGVTGLDLTHKTVGPALVKHLLVEGFDKGIELAWQEYSMTFEHITLRGQNEVGLLNRGNIAAVRGLVSHNRVPAVICQGGNSMLSLVDSWLEGGDPGIMAIEAHGGLYVARTVTAGYGGAIEKHNHPCTRTGPEGAETTVHRVPGPDIDEFTGDQVVTGHGVPADAAGSLGLPVRDTPERPDIHPSEWVNVRDFEHLVEDDDWTVALQAAIDSGARVLYFPWGGYRVSEPVQLRGRVERLVGFNSSVSLGEGLGPTHRVDQNDPDPPPPAFVFARDAGGGEQPLWIERLGISGLVHDSPHPLVLWSSNPGRYENRPGCGPLFIEDTVTANWHFLHPQQVWARQWNPESHAAGPCIRSHGATIWALGFKTEYPSEKLSASDGAQTEILGAFIYPIGDIPPDRPIFRNRDSRMSVIYGTSVYKTNHRVHILDTAGDETLTFGNDEVRWAGSRARMDLFVSEGRSEGPPE